jgi:two-component system chemotaxis response regulator CheB
MMVRWRVFVVLPLTLCSEAQSRVYGQKMLTVILTGMGQDGLNGSREVIAAGGRVIAQNEATSVVWGMPGAVSLAGLCTAVLPLDEIAPWLRKSALRLGSG